MNAFNKPTVMALVLILGLGLSASAQDPGLPDSMVIGNIDGSLIYSDIAQQILVPVWVKTDDSVTFAHIPLSTSNSYITSRDGGVLYPPMNLWDDVEFLAPNNNSPIQGWKNQSLLGYAYTSPPRDPQNFLHTNYQWVHIADFRMSVSNDPNIYGDTTCLIEGFSPYYGYLLWALPDGVTQFQPRTVYSCITFVSNIEPVITQPPDGIAYDVNQEYPFSIEVIATDADAENISLTVSFPGSNYQFIDLQTYPGYTRKEFRWTPQLSDDGPYAAVFTANDGSGGIDIHTMTLNISPCLLDIAEKRVLLGSDVVLPISLDNSGVSSYVGGFEILVRFDEPMLCLTGVTRTSRLDEWDYFHYNVGDTSTIRIVGLADVTGNGQYLAPGQGPIINLNFLVSSDEQYMSTYAWVHFISYDNNDNTIADSTGYVLIHPVLDDGWIYAMDPDEILIADINLNTVAWEISDAVLLANYLVDPQDFPLSQIQLIAADCNGDNQQGTLADLIYLINVIVGISDPPKIGYGLDLSATISLDDLSQASGRFSVNYNSDIPAGGVLVRIEHHGAEIGNVLPATSLTTHALDKDGILTVLIYDFEGGYIVPGSRLFEIEKESGEFNPSFTEIQVSDRYGNVVPAEGRVTVSLPISYRLFGAYPNPFNSSTTIAFSLPAMSDVELTIYNVLGQQIRTLRAEAMTPGQGSLVWDGFNESGQPVASGVYLYRLEAGQFSATSRMVLLR